MLSFISELIANMGSPKEPVKLEYRRRSPSHALGRTRPRALLSGARLVRGWRPLDIAGAEGVFSWRAPLRGIRGPARHRPPCACRPAEKTHRGGRARKILLSGAPAPRGIPPHRHGARSLSCAACASAMG